MPAWTIVVLVNLGAAAAIAVWLIEDAFGFPVKGLRTIGLKLVIAVSLVGFGAVILIGLIAFTLIDRRRIRRRGAR